ncbi:MAG: IS66 family insertion sequence element accessory protein TnpB [Acidobacteriota bacterium]
MWVYAKRLEKERFRWLEKREGEASVGMRQEELAALVAGLHLGPARPRRGWLRIAGKLKFREENALSVPPEGVKRLV